MKMLKPRRGTIAEFTKSRSPASAAAPAPSPSPATAAAAAKTVPPQLSAANRSNYQGRVPRHLRKVERKFGFDAGDIMPEWSAYLTDHTGGDVRLSDMDKDVLLVLEPTFMQGAVTDAWIRILNDLRDVVGSDRDDVVVVGISPGAPSFHAKMILKYGYKFALLSDPSRRLLIPACGWNADRFRAGLKTPRSTYLVSPSALIRHVWRPVNPVGHAEEVRQFLAGLQASPAPSQLSSPTEAPMAAATLARPVWEPRPQAGPGGDGGPAADEAAEMLTVDPTLVGFLIGRNGSQVRSIGLRTGVRVHIDTDNGQITFVGSREQREAAMALVKELAETTGEEILELEPGVRGLIIGPGGQTIREVEAVSGAMVRLPNNFTDRRAFLSGTREQRATAREMLGKLLLEAEFMEEIIAIDQALQAFEIRLLQGSRLERIRELEGRFGARIRVDVGARNISIRGTKAQRLGVRTELEAWMQELKEETTMPIPENIQARFIGAGGVNIRRAELVSGARFQVMGPPDNCVVIRGLTQQRMKGVAMVEQMLDDHAIISFPIEDRLRRVVMGPGGSTVKKLEQTTGANISILHTGPGRRRPMPPPPPPGVDVLEWRATAAPEVAMALVEIRGSRQAREAAEAALRRRIFSNETVEREKVNRSWVAALMRDRGVALEEAERVEDTCVVFLWPEDPSLDDNATVTMEVWGEPPGRAATLARIRLAAARGATLPPPEGPGSWRGVGLVVVDRWSLAGVVGEGPGRLNASAARRMMAAKGPVVKDIEAKSGAEIRITNLPEPAVTIGGSAEARAAALAMLRSWLSSLGEEERLMSAQQQGVLIGVGGRTVQMLENKTGTLVIFLDGPSRVRICGTEEQRRRAWELADSILANEIIEFYPVPFRLFGAVVGQGGKNARELERVTGARIQVLTSQSYDSATLKKDFQIDSIPPDQILVVIKGSVEQRDAARKRLANVVDDGLIEEMEVEAEWADEDGGWKGLQAKLAALAAYSGAALTLSEDKRRVVIAGPILTRDRAKRSIRGLGRERDEEEKIDMKDRMGPLEVRLFIGPEGRRVKALEVETETRIRFLPGPVLAIRGSPDARARVLRFVQDELDRSSEESVALPRSKHFIIIGARGEVIRRIERESGAVLRMAQEEVVVKGSDEQREAALKLIAEVVEAAAGLDSDFVPLEPAAINMVTAFNGKRIRAMETSSGARIWLEAAGQSAGSGLRISGTAEQRAAAQRLVQGMAEMTSIERFPVPIAFHRALVGVRGATVSRLEQESGCHISFNVEGGGTMLVRGRAEDRRKAFRLAQEVMAADEEEQFYVECRYHSYLIGPGGSRVRELEAATGTRIAFPGDADPVVVIRGRRESRDAAWEKLKAFMDQADAQRRPSPEPE